MSALAVVLLAVLAGLPSGLAVLPARLRPPEDSWLPPAAALLLLAVAGLLAARAGTLHGAAAGLAQVLGAAAAAGGAGPVVRAAFRVAVRTQAPVPAPQELLRGGAVIGVLERAGVVLALLAGYPEGLAVVLAVKGLARYPELREARAGEQFIIGTFTSVLWAVGCWATAAALLG